MDAEQTRSGKKTRIECGIHQIMEQRASALFLGKGNETGRRIQTRTNPSDIIRRQASCHHVILGNDLGHYCGETARAWGIVIT